MDNPNLTFSQFAKLLDTYEPTELDYAEYAAWLAEQERRSPWGADREMDDAEYARHQLEVLTKAGEVDPPY